MMRTFMALALGLLLLPQVSAAQGAEEDAGQVSEIEKADRGPLRERIPPVSGHVFLMKGRVEISPSAMVSLNDAFFTKYVLGGTVAYHITESWGLMLRLGDALVTPSGAAEICTTQSTGGSVTLGCRSPTQSELNGVAPGQIVGPMGGLDLQWAPIYGKLALWAELFVPFNMYAFAGPQLLQYQGPDLSGRTLAVGGDVGLGLRFFLNRWMTLRTELKDLIYSEKVTLLDHPSLRNQLFFELGVSFFIPTNFNES